MKTDLDDLQELLPDWLRHLRARKVATSTVTSYRTVAEEFVSYLVAEGLPTIAEQTPREWRGHIENYLVHLQTRPSRRGGHLSPAQVAKHYRSLQQWFRWLSDVEELIDVSPFAKMSPPEVPEVPVPVLTPAQLRELLLTCKGRTFTQLRDRALLWLFIDTGCRAGEIAPLRLERPGPNGPESDLDFEQDVVHVVGKGSRPRAVPFGAKSGEALRRYLRARNKHPWAAKSDAVWLGTKGPLTDSGIRQLLDRRADDAKVPRIHPHMFRHTFSHNWLAAGGQETDLMRIMGWKSRQMVQRYAASAADERARQAYRRLELDADL